MAYIVNTFEHVGWGGVKVEQVWTCPKGCLPRGLSAQLWTEWLTDKCKNITLPQTSFGDGNKMYFVFKCTIQFETCMHSQLPCRKSTHFLLVNKGFYNGCLWENLLNHTLHKKFWLNFTKIIIDNHYEIICGLFTSEYNRGHRNIWWNRSSSSHMRIRVKFYQFMCRSSFTNER